MRIKQRDIRIHLFFVIIQRSFIDYSKFLIHWESQHSKNKRKSLTESEEKVKHQFSIYNFTFKHCPSITSPTTSPQPTTHLPQYSHFFPITSNSSHKNKWIIFIFLSVVFPLFKHLKYLSSMFVTRHGHWYGTPWHCTWEKRTLYFRETKNKHFTRSLVVRSTEWKKLLRAFKTTFQFKNTFQAKTNVLL